MEALRESHPPLFRRHARRPRLTRLLDASTAQTILVTAPAGYGKTTLAAEWVQGREDVVWYRATSSSADVAAFSAGLADVITPLVPGVGDRLKQRLRVADTPERAARPLAEILSEDLAEWPPDALLIVDDYHLVVDSTPVEEFMDWLLTLTPSLHVLVTARRRPKWASARRVLYGEITEIDRTQLAMTTEEAALVLEGRSTEEVRALVQQAEGWPALIGLAALSAKHEIPTERVSEALYRYFAEEVLRGETSEVERFLLIASVPEEIDQSAITELLGEATTGAILSHLTEEGIVEKAGQDLRLHPLLRTFLRQSLREADPALFEKVVETTLQTALAQRRWESAFDLAIETEQIEIAIDILGASVTELLAAGQTELLARWLEDCGVLGVDHPAAMLTRIELLIRRGHLSEALPMARDLAQSLDSSDYPASRAWYLAGFSAHLLSQEEAALNFHLQAREHASEPTEEADALWGAHLAAIELERAEAATYLAELEALGRRDAPTRLRIAVGRMGNATASANVRGVINRVNPLVALAERTGDPMVATSFFTRIAEVQIIRSRYEEALELAMKGLAIASALHLDFALGYCLVGRINAEIALRRPKAARSSLKTLTETLYRREDPYIELEHQVLHMKMKLAAPRHRLNQTVFPEHIWRDASSAVKSEYLGLRALCATFLEDPDKALALARQARGVSDGADARFTAQFAAAIALRTRNRDEKAFRNSVIELTLECAEAEVLDPLVLAARTDFNVASAVRADPAAKAIFRDVLIRSRDEAIARPAGLISEEMDDAVGERVDKGLTPREVEVLHLMSRGLSNSAIAGRLFISESTVKVHVRHVLKKLNVETRLQAALKAAKGDFAEPL
jgi:ATP/maltotriose-dependent transcriptional regulator MalT